MFSTLVLAQALITPPRTTAQIGRRALLASAAGLACSTPRCQPAAAEDNNGLVALGTVKVKDGVTQPSQERGALYVTARIPPNRLSAGKVPPLATARYAAPVTFPFEVRLTAADLTPEYAGVPASEWSGQDLTLSARWDCDGTAATRDPDDLVGRGQVVGGRPAVVVLEGRGLTGRVLTAK